VRQTRGGLQTGADPAEIEEAEKTANLRADREFERALWPKLYSRRSQNEFARLTLTARFKPEMQFLRMSLVAVALLIFVIGCQRATDEPQTASAPVPSPTASVSPPTDEFASVRPIFAESCARCHRDDGAGGLYENEGRRLRVPSLREGRAVGHSDARYVRQITNGGDGMPAFGDRLSPEQINEFVRFVRRTFQNQ